MSDTQTPTSRWRLPSVQDLEASHYELQAGIRPEVQEQGIEQGRGRYSAWPFRMFARSPDSINEKRRTLLSNPIQRPSFDVESQASTDASTLLEDERIDKPKRSRIDARVVSDAIIGLSDGLTVPFALTAGLSALGNTKVVIFAGLAELTAGAISMGLGGYLGAKSEEESYAATLALTQELVLTSSTTAADSIRDIFEPYNLPVSLTEDLAFHLAKSTHLTQFLMHFQHNAPEQTSSRAVSCALTIACGYFLGGFIPLLPYFLVNREEVMLALWWSLGVMAVSLFAFGFGKTWFASGSYGWKNIWEGFKMMLVGGIAAGSAMGLVRLFNSFI